MSIEAMKQAYQILITEPHSPTACDKLEVILRQAIAEAEKQVSYTGNGTAGRENMTAPTGFFFQMPKHEWVETTEKDVHECFMLTEFDYHVDFNRDPEQWCLVFAKELSDTLKQKNGFAEENT